MGFKNAIVDFSYKTAMAAGILLFAAGETDALEVSLGENDVISLANSPFINSKILQIDTAGRPSILLDATFINQCTLETGISAIHYQNRDDEPDVIILKQRIADEGCPDIASPANQKIRILLPPDIRSKGIYLVSKPWRADTTGPYEKPLLSSQPSSGKHDIAVEALSQLDRQIVHTTIDNLEPAAKAGYTISGKIALGKCKHADLNTFLFEIPDEQGNPISDILLLTLPKLCAGQSIDTDLRIKLAIPQRGLERSITILNESKPNTRNIK